MSRISAELLRRELGPVAWWDPALRLRWAHWCGLLRQHRTQMRRSGRRMVQQHGRWVTLRYNISMLWQNTWWCLTLRTKVLAVQERDLRLDREEAHFHQTGDFLRLPPGRRERDERLLGYAGMHFDTLTRSDGQPTWVHEMGLHDVFEGGETE